MLYQLDETYWSIDFQEKHDLAAGNILLFQGGNLIVPASGDLVLQAQDILNIEVDSVGYIASLQDVPWFAGWLDESYELPEGWGVVTVRDVAQQNEQAFAMVSRAVQLHTWRQDHRFCGRCGHRTRYFDHEPGAHCDYCGLTAYPRISPCVIVLVYRGEEVLLANGVRHKDSGMYSTLAGFVEAGESAEQAVYREILEEVGVRVKNIRYLNSQTWPFPHQLMLGYEAEYESGDIQIQEHEIVDARWFHIEDLPKYAPNLSIAGWMIERHRENIRLVKK
ncbi:NAD(+) diphosphatase [Gynuella sunshinyii]|uniref:NAD(+) diphosphatase n=1 Tax=Gynuella sunshinyii YC6258 TaxID=1445510 RepID=A0A0C5VMM6_9GAMM|nr:NAD(+) diphosphatase [Gynuella sunshinyii]AJQ94593.1 NTP pyrophosphohydrolase containing a Zn-finger, probably nucleic-acid-binding [Gynuella sunshinyii YC6258]